MVKGIIMYQISYKIIGMVSIQLAYRHITIWENLSALIQVVTECIWEEFSMYVQLLS